MSIIYDNLKLVQLRRKEESREFQENLKSTNNNEESHLQSHLQSQIQSQSFYALELEWFFQWKCFVMNDTTEKLLSNSKKKISINKSIGTLPPGPITNINLFEKGVKDYTEKNLKKGLKKNEDYVIVNEKIWKMFLHNYNGGPEIQLSKNDDVYVSFISVNNKEYLTYSNIRDLLIGGINCSNFSMEKLNNTISVEVQPDESGQMRNGVSSSVVDKDGIFTECEKIDGIAGKININILESKVKLK
jgi:hypothetical protein